jgi:hypothetical protein
MNEDVRDDLLTGLLDAAVRGIEPAADARLPDVLRRGGRRRAVRWTAIGTALAVFLGAVVWGAANVGHGQSQPLDVASWSTYRDPDRWSVRYPPGWNVQPFSTSSGDIHLQGALFSNVGYRFRHPDLGPSEFTTAWDLSRLPEDAVVVEVERFLGGPSGPRTRPPDTTFPLSIGGATSVNDSPTPGPPGHLQLPFVNAGRRFTLNLWFGAAASRRDREIAGLIVHSVTFGPDTTDWTRAGSLDTTGWTLAYPPHWRIQDLPACPNAPDRTGAVVTSAGVRVAFPTGPPNCEGVPRFNPFPPDGIAFAVIPVGVRFGLAFPELNTPFPVSWDQLVPAGESSSGPPEHYLGITVRKNLIMMVRAWIGPSASPAAVEDLKAVVASLEVKGATHWTIYRNDGRGFSVTYPDDWVRAGQSLTPELGFPRDFLSLGTYPLRPGGKACFDAYLPGNALADLGHADAFVTVQEASPEGMPARPPTIGPDAATVTVDGLPACDEYKSIQLEGWWIPFADQGRGFYVFVAVGPFASNDQQTMAVVWHIVNSLQFDPL